MKKLNFIVTNEIYRFGVMFSFGETDEELKRKLKKFGITDTSVFNYKLLLGQCSQFKTGDVLVRMPQLPKTPKQFGTLQHEIFHATKYIMDHIESRLSDDSEENWAYFLGFLTEKAYEKLKI